MENLENHNFRADSKGWKEITVDGEKYLENPEGDVWEISEGDCKGEQLFTWDAAMRETKKAGKRMPTDEEYLELVKEKDDISNLVFAGCRLTDGSFLNRGPHSDLWSSTPSGGNAWNRSLYSGYTTVNRFTGAKAFGFSVRCLID